METEISMNYFSDFSDSAKLFAENVSSLDAKVEKLVDSISKLLEDVWDERDLLIGRAGSWR